MHPSGGAAGDGDRAPGGTSDRAARARSSAAGTELGLAGKRALVTGASRGVGAAAARLLARLGADAGLSCRTRLGDAERVAAEARGLGVRAWAEAGDLSDPDAVDRLFARADAEFDGLDFFVGAAGIWPVADVPLAEMGASRWRRTIAANLNAVFHTTREALRRMAPGGRVVLVSSTASQRGEAGHADYAASKGAVNALVKSVCVEAGRRGITVNAVAPGWIDTDMSRDVLHSGARAAIEAAIPLGRVATATDVAGTIAFLCSSWARHVTGEILNVNGGAVLAG